jgi:hypothetical protein
MTITLIFATMFCALVASLALIGGELVRLRWRTFSAFRGWGARLVSVFERIVFRPVLATVGVSTSAWTVEVKAKACTVLGFAALALTLLFGSLASRVSP